MQLNWTLLVLTWGEQSLFLSGPPQHLFRGCSAHHQTEGLCVLDTLDLKPIILRSLVSKSGSAWRSPQGGASPSTLDQQHRVQQTPLNLKEMATGLISALTALFANQVTRFNLLHVAGLTLPSFRSEIGIILPGGFGATPGR